ncbi:Hypothetical protein ERS075534_03265 [Mycobacteroides abscessus]|uniref:hypothetical protein n=1 Tax=Mycobacteroides abscessus TaxID=36809 RepID=UPI0005E828E6|nr:hypothetical protein [Mycobacteroides abscessus]CPT64615.1 Hypothetical protein ERS075534_03265 [Mycobacteroides abscessus]CPU56998.1 Hypothetical protein ERS075561_03432 [Mycobacteroides abscessus]SKJ84233.1 Uncharacterised protein [Mycobacteroides abscessus subsp. massiliense]SKQ05612.1 Uncharacterised protein [Mycobacteroides abscessus subsp. massiliense]SKV52906.1 Uncharacterised protein [Mycobacteroides abscessus subsp. massiliense]
MLFSTSKLWGESVKKLMQTTAAAAMVAAGFFGAAPVAEADPVGLPAGFPDMSSYTVVSAREFAPPNAKVISSISFVTPNGVGCTMGGNVTCSGEDLPGLPPSVHVQPEGACAIYHATASPMEGAFSREVPPQIRCGPGNNQNAESFKPLLPFQKLVRYDKDQESVACGVDDQGTTACYSGIDRNGRRHGFVLSPAGSWTF